MAGSHCLDTFSLSDFTITRRPTEDTHRRAHKQEDAEEGNVARRNDATECYSHDAVETLRHESHV